MSAIPWDKEEESKSLGKHFTFESEEDLTAFKAKIQAAIPDMVPVGWVADVYIQLQIRKDVSV